MKHLVHLNQSEIRLKMTAMNEELPVNSLDKAAVNYTDEGLHPTPNSLLNSIMAEIRNQLVTTAVFRALVKAQFISYLVRS